MKRIIAGCLAVAVIGYAVVGMVSAQSSPLSYPGSNLTCTNAVSGDGWITLAAKVGAPSAVALANQEGGTLSTNIRVGQRVCYAASPTLPPTTTAPPTTQPPTTSTTTTTLPPTTTSTTTTSTTTTTQPPTTTAPPTTAPPAGAFIETFTGNTGLERFDYDIYHRGGLYGPGQTVSADHDMSCGDPSTQRVVHADVVDESFYLCRDHLMTAVGDWTGYSTAWFSPKQTFTTQRTVSWDVNVTDLNSRKWWEVLIVPDEFNSGIESCPQCATMDWIAQTAVMPEYPPGAIAVGNGPAGRDINIWSNGDQHEPNGWLSCEGASCTSKLLRLSFSITDNRNGTLTVDFGGFETFTVPGSFPAGGFNVIFKDHNYTPDKDGPIAGYTWHWDNVSIQ